MISDATRTIEDSQTAQALHGLLSLKSPETNTNSNFPALLKAVGQQVGGQAVQIQGQVLGQQLGQGEAIQVIRTDGNQVELSPSPHTSVQLKPVPSSPVQSKTPTASGSMMQLLLQMQSQANAAAKKGSESRPSNLTASLLEAAKQPVSKPAALGSASQSLSQLIKAQVTSQPMQVRPAQLTPANIPPQQSAAHGNTPLILQTQNRMAPQTPQAVPLQLITQKGVVSPTVLQGTKPGEQIILPPGIQLPPGLTPVLVQNPSSVVLARSTTDVNPVYVKTESVKRPLSVIEGEPLPKIMRTVGNTMPLASSNQTSGAVTLVVQSMGTPMPHAHPPSLSVPTHTTAAPNTLSKALAAAVTQSVLSPDSVTEKTHATANITNLAVSISEGYDDIFRNIRSRAADLKQNGTGGQTKMVIEQVVAEQITNEIINNSVSFVSSRATYVRPCTACHPN